METTQEPMTGIDPDTIADMTASFDKHGWPVWLADDEPAEVPEEEE